MGRPPAVVIVVRHGARLDAADRHWHFTSPTPYDSPLTYGGWTQSRALGARIGSLLHARERSNPASRKGSIDSLASGVDHATLAAEASSPAGQQRDSPKPPRSSRRKHKIVIHSSPFSRCVQTSIAISAGMAQYHAAHHPANRKPSRMHSTSPVRRSHSRSPGLEAIPEPSDSPTRHVLEKAHHRKHHRNPVLRVDAFLGEWLSPDYFEHITPPPSSLMMVAGAKADLLRRGDYLDFAPAGSEKRPSPGNFPGGWSKQGSSTTAPATAEDSTTSPASELQETLSRRDRSSSTTSLSSSSSSRTGGRAVDVLSPPASRDIGYTPPTPTWAISTSDPIPRGYVAHARDHCVDVDYQWDSMREPLDWGNGGEYGEEWSSMHKRFRKGIQKMVEWYSEQDESSDKPEDDDDVDTVLVLVTHGAGCNALIGALTNQPVLLDVGMASLTMAVRKDTAISQPTSPVDGQRSVSEALAHKRRSSIDAGLSETYDVKLVASTEHLRPGSNPLITVQRGSLTAQAHVSTHRQRHGSLAPGASPSESPFPLTEVNAALGGVRRSSSTASTWARSHAFGSRSNSMGGLWSKPQALQEAQEPLGSPAPAANQAEEDDEYALSISGELRRPSQAGLWGSAPLPEKTERDKGPKRRWTIDESRDH